MEVYVIAFVGYVLQWLRGFRWFTDGITIAVCVLGGVLAVLIDKAVPVHDYAQFAGAVLKSTLTMLGGTMVGHIAANSGSPVMLAPKWNALDGGGK